MILTLWPCQPFYDLKSKIRSLIHYILRVFTLIFIINGHSHIVRSEICALFGLLADLRKAHLLKEKIFGILWCFFLKEGVTTRVCMIIFLMNCKYFSAKLLD
jgi:hypothetical protein